MAGNVRWLLHDLDGALLEYQDAQARAESDLVDYARRQVASARDELARRDAAASIGKRNGWLALAVAVVLAAVFVGAVRAARA